MTSTPFSKRVDILGEVYAQAQSTSIVYNQEFWDDWQDTMWICLASKVGYIDINPSYEWAVNGAWEAFCLVLGVDHYGEFDSLTEVLSMANE